MVIKAHFNCEYLYNLFYFIKETASIIIYGADYSPMIHEKALKSDTKCLLFTYMETSKFFILRNNIHTLFKTISENCEECKIHKEQKITDIYLKK